MDVQKDDALAVCVMEELEYEVHGNEVQEEYVDDEVLRDGMEECEDDVLMVPMHENLVEYEDGDGEVLEGCEDDDVRVEYEDDEEPEDGMEVYEDAVLNVKRMIGFFQLYVEVEVLTQLKDVVEDLGEWDAKGVGG